VLSPVLGFGRPKGPGARWWRACMCSPLVSRALPAGPVPANVGMMSFPQPEEVVGRTASVTIAIPGGDRAGEVLVRIRGGTESYIAYADEPVGLGEDVVVIADKGARTLVVALL
jgi:hypothetical protein